MVESLKPQAPEGYRCLTEGQANILYIDSKLKPDEDNMVKIQGRGKRQANEVNENRGAVFYNPVQEFNRDFSIMAINQFSQKLKAEKEAKDKEFTGINVLEALAATGLRSVRYMKEIPSIHKLVANDIDSTATKLIQDNFNFNQVDPSKTEGKSISQSINQSIVVPADLV
jgi:tRNA G26 N,N-dimethylase Trm1